MINNATIKLAGSVVFLNSNYYTMFRSIINENIHDTRSTIYSHTHAS